MAGRPERNEWDEFTEVAWDKKGRCVQVQCKHCPWRGSHHATRCALHYAKKHAYRAVYLPKNAAPPAPGLHSHPPAVLILFHLF